MDDKCPNGAQTKEQWGTMAKGKGEASGRGMPGAEKSYDTPTAFNLTFL